MSASSATVGATPPPLAIPKRTILREARDLTTLSRYMEDARPIATVKLGPTRVVPPLVVVLNAHGARELLVDYQECFDKGVGFHIEFQRLLGRSSFSMNDAEWAPRRRALQPVMNKRHVDGFVAHMQAAAEQAISAWPRNGVAELTDLGRAITLDVIGRSLFGLDLAARRSTVAPALHRSLRRVLLRGLAPTPLPNWLRLRRSWRDRAVLYDTVREAIDLAIGRRAADSAAPTEDLRRGGELVDLLLDATDPQTGERLDRHAIADELITFFGAGHDTTATALSAGLWLLARHPEIQDRVRAEVSALDKKLDADSLGRLPYTRQVLDETMRLYPPAIAIPRVCTTETNVLGYRIPARWTAAALVWSIHRDPEVYPDPTVFDPERFVPSAVAGRDKCAYMPFGAGRRACSGSHFATLETMTALAVIVRQFRLTSDLPKLRLSTPFTLNVEPPVSATVTRVA